MSTASDNAFSELEVTKQLEINASRQFTSWMFEHKLSFLFTTYQTGKLFLIGLQPDGRLSVFERSFNRCMGLFSPNNQTFYMSSLYQLWRFENALAPGQLHNDHDRLYVPQAAYTTGDIDVHDIALDQDGRLVFVNSLFSCLATTDDTHSFTPIWKPPFISKLAAEDRCHLNGLATDQDNHIRYVTAISESDANEGWRDHREQGGIVIDVNSNDIIARSLSMPHSPRLYQDKLWLLNSGTGYFGYIDINKGSFEPVAFCPGYTRGLAFHGDFALIGLSMPRHNKTFSGLTLDNNLQQKKVSPRCGIEVVDLRSGDVVHSLRIEGMITELYDVCVIPDVFRPMALGLQTEEIRRIITLGGTLDD